MVLGKLRQLINRNFAEIEIKDGRNEVGVSFLDEPVVVGFGGNGIAGSFGQRVGEGFPLPLQERVAVVAAFANGYPGEDEYQNRRCEDRNYLYPFIETV